MGSVPDVQPRVYVLTLGCPKNEADSRAVMRHLQKAGVTVVEDPGPSTHILVNTCGFIQDAKEESIGAILSACAGFPDRPVLVMGCLVERYRGELAAGIPEVAGWFGLAGEETSGRIRDLLAGGASGAEVGARPGLPGKSYAYLKISDGCDELCSFCAIPSIKGRYESAGYEEILAEADRCLGEGARELVLVGQDTTRWSDQGRTLPELVDSLAADERVRRIRVMYLQPERVGDDLLRYMASQPKLCRYLDMPFQHSHPEMLRRMSRWGDEQQYLQLIGRARRLMPDVSVRSTFIVGFPGETSTHFEHLLRFVEVAGFDYAGGFIYSPEEGTMAAGLRPRVRAGVARTRLNRLEAVLAERAERQHEGLVGARVEVMIDSVDPQEVGEEATALGRTAGQAPEVDGVTYIESALPAGIGPGDVVTVRILAAVGYDLIGECDRAP